MHDLIVVSQEKDQDYSVTECCGVFCFLIRNMITIRVLKKGFKHEFWNQFGLGISIIITKG